MHKIYKLVIMVGKRFIEDVTIIIYISIKFISISLFTLLSYYIMII